MCYQVILNHCDARKEEEIAGPSKESPQSSFTLLMTPTHPPNTADSAQKESSSETTANSILSQEVPIDLRVKIAICLIYLRNLHHVKVHSLQYGKFSIKPHVKYYSPYLSTLSPILIYPFLSHLHIQITINDKPNLSRV